MRKKNMLLIILVVFFSTAATFLSGLYFTNNSLVETMEQDMAFAIGIADDLVSNRVLLIKSTAESIAKQLRMTGSDESLEEAMKAEFENNPDISGLFLFNENGIIANYSEPQHVHDLDIKPEHLEMVNNGRTIISSPFYCSVTKEFVINVFTLYKPGTVLAMTIPGLTFSDLLADHQLWMSGHIFMLDENGTFIGSADQEIVLAMNNYITGIADPSEQEEGKIGGLIRNILNTESGVYQYNFQGTERLCAYSLINDTVMNWHVAVTILIKESPQSDALTGHMYAAVLSLFAGAAAAVFLSRLTERPYKKIEAQNRELEALMVDVESANNAKSAFLAKISHEMRTPLNAVIGLSEITFNSANLDKDAKTNLEKIYNSGYTLLSIVNDVLDISKIQSGKFVITPINYDVPSLINDTVIQNALRIGSKPIRLFLNISGDLPAKMYGDELRVKQIVNNLLSNAIKYTEQGEVELGFDCEKDGDSFWLTIQVRDTGVGIHEENLHMLFDEYIQLGTSDGQRLGGTGLGLPITKNLAEMMDGEIFVESVYGEGSTFTAKIRQGFVNGDVIGNETAESLRNFQYSASRLNRSAYVYRVQLPDARVLVVDDNITNLDVARGIMKPYGMKVDCVTNGQEAVRLVSEAKVEYDAIFMDHMMPEMDGITATRFIREIGTDYAETVPIIALTANAVVGNEEMFLSNGFNGFISKPIDLARLDGIIRKYLRHKKDGVPRGYEETAAVDSELLDLAEGSKWIDIAAGLSMYGGEKAYMSILRSFAVNTAPLLESIRNVTKDKLDDYAITVHGIKGAARNICAKGIGDLAERIENAARAGNWDFIHDKTSVFIISVSSLIKEIDDMLNRYASSHPKPKKDKPDPQDLTRLYTACVEFDFTAIEDVMNDIEMYDYMDDGGISLWLRENIIKMNIQQVIERLGELVK